MGDTYYTMRLPPRNVPFFHSLAIYFIKRYERLWDWCISKKPKLIFIKIILINPSASCLFVVNYRVYEKYDHLCAIFWFPHSKWSYCWWAIVSFYHQQILTTQNESLYQFHLFSCYLMQSEYDYERWAAVMWHNFRCL